MYRQGFFAGAIITNPVHSQVVVDHFYIELFSAFEQTHCDLVQYDSQLVNVALYSRLLNSHQSGVLTELFGCYLAGAK